MKQISVVFVDEDGETTSLVLAGENVGYRLTDMERWVRVYKGNETIIIPLSRVIRVEQRDT